MNLANEIRSKFRSFARNSEDDEYTSSRGRRCTVPRPVEPVGPCNDGKTEEEIAKEAKEAKKLQKKQFGEKLSRIMAESQVKFAQSRESVHKISDLYQASNIQDRIDDMNKRVEVEIVSVIAPDEFYVRSPKDKPYMDQLEDEIERHVHDNASCFQQFTEYDINYLVTYGGYVILKSVDIHSWCRGWVVHQDGLKATKRKDKLSESYLYNTNCSVYLIDYGWKQIVNPGDLAPCPDELVDFNKWPVKIMRCALHGMIPLSTTKGWEWDTVLYFGSFLFDHKRLWIRIIEEFNIFDTLAVIDTKEGECIKSDLNDVSKDGEKKKKRLQIKCYSVAVKYIGHEIKYRVKNEVKSHIIRLHDIEQVLVCGTWMRYGTWMDYQRDYRKEAFMGGINVHHLPQIPGIIDEVVDTSQKEKFEKEKQFLDKIRQTESKHDMVLMGTLIKWLPFDINAVEDAFRDENEKISVKNVKNSDESAKVSTQSIKSWNETEDILFDEEEPPYHMYKVLEYSSAILNGTARNQCIKNSSFVPIYLNCRLSIFSTEKDEEKVKQLESIKRLELYQTYFVDCLQRHPKTSFGSFFVDEDDDGDDISEEEDVQVEPVVKKVTFVDTYQSEADVLKNLMTTCGLEDDFNKLMQVDKKCQEERKKKNLDTYQRKLLPRVVAVKKQEVCINIPDESIKMVQESIKKADEELKEKYSHWM